MMNKLTGLKDPMLNLMINAPETFKEMYNAMPAGSKKEEYKRLIENERTITAYHNRIKTAYDDPAHAGMRNGGQAFYTGNHFRFRDHFASGFPIAWFGWDSYWDANFDGDKYGSG
jgi:hypothetical protein